MKRHITFIFICCFSIMLGEGSEGKNMLKECPNTPNCVSSESKDKKHYVEPIAFTGSAEEIKKELIKVIEKFQGKVIENKTNYLEAAFYSKFFGFEDIADFEIDPNKKIINIRSAAQTGWYDFGVNRKRMEKIRSELKEKEKILL